MSCWNKANVYRHAARDRQSGNARVAKHLTPGIQPGNEARIFEPFFATKPDVGIGLGLWITKELVQETRRHHFLPQQTTEGPPEGLFMRQAISPSKGLVVPLTTGLSNYP
jgi:K+-sensing histidine kinase KdpD